MPCVHHNHHFYNYHICDCLPCGHLYGHHLALAPGMMASCPVSTLCELRKGVLAQWYRTCGLSLGGSRNAYNETKARVLITFATGVLDAFEFGPEWTAAGVIDFDSSVVTVSELSTNRAAVQAAIESSKSPSGGTHISAGLMAGLGLLTGGYNRSGARQVWEDVYTGYALTKVVRPPAVPSAKRTVERPQSS